MFFPLKKEENNKKYNYSLTAVTRWCQWTLWPADQIDVSDFQLTGGHLRWCAVALRPLVATTDPYLWVTHVGDMKLMLNTVVATYGWLVARKHCIYYTKKNCMMNNLTFLSKTRDLRFLWSENGPIFEKFPCFPKTVTPLSCVFCLCIVLYYVYCIAYAWQWPYHPNFQFSGHKTSGGHGLWHPTLPKYFTATCYQKLKKYFYI